MFGFLLLFLVSATNGSKFRENAEARASGASYDYSATGEAGPEFWESMFPDYCAGSEQSPINLKDPQAKTCEPFQFSGYNVVPDDMVIANAGLTAKVTVAMDPMPAISGGCLNETYEFLQMHWHWGSSSDKGSEHQINGVSYSMELHLVHWNTMYGTVAEALKNSDGLAVLGIMVKESLSAPAGSPYNTVAKVLKNIRQPKQTTSMTPIKLEDFLPADVSTYYRYCGSLTTPTCNEIVTWSVFQDNVQISKKDINKFRKLEDTDGNSQSNNFRPVQPLNGRNIYLVGA